MKRWRHILRFSAVAAALTLAAATATRLPLASAGGDEALDALRSGNEARALAALSAAAARGDAQAANLLGEMARLDAGSAADLARACDLFETAAAAGLAAAQHNLATCHYTGAGRERDYRQSFGWYGRAADQGYARSFCALGNHFLYGQAVRQDMGTALELCRRGAQAGDSDAQADLGLLYLGVGDDGEALKWLSLAASNGLANAALHLGRMHGTGAGVPKNPHVAAYWFRAAAERGRPDAFFLAGQTYFAMTMSADGRTVNELYAPQALLWLALAAEFEPDPAKRAEALRLRAAVAAAAPHLKAAADEQTAVWRSRMAQPSGQS